MTIITSAVGICNLALGHLKINPIASIEAPESIEASICAKYYDITRQAVLESYNWAFAMKRATLAEDSSDPVFGWTSQSSTMPADFLKLVGVYNSNGQMYINTDNEYFEFEGGRILTDLAAPYYIKYIADINDVAKFDRLFVMNLSFALAVNMSENLKVSSTLLQVVLQKWQDIWEKNATAINGGQTGIKRVNSSKYINARRV